MANARSDKGQRVTKTRTSAHAARTPIGDTRRRQQNEGGEQRRQRTLISKAATYSGANTAAMRAIADGVPTEDLQIRKISGGFGLYRRDLL